MLKFLTTFIFKFQYRYYRTSTSVEIFNKKLSYCWETVRRESMPRIAEMDVKITT